MEQQCEQEVRMNKPKELELQLDTVLTGQGLVVQDWTVRKDRQPVRPFLPILRKTVSYIVAAVIFNDKGEVLMMQEAKPDCHGLWYLPAGHLEPGEQLTDGLRREVLEETGLECQPITLLCVESRTPKWLRFSFIAQHTGGIMKTPAEADKESLQAAWWDHHNKLPLRAPDVLPLVQAGLAYRKTPHHPPTLPTAIPNTLICHRLIIVCRARGRLCVLTRCLEPGGCHLPVIPCKSHDNLLSSIISFLCSCLHNMHVVSHLIKVLGTLGVQHMAGIAGMSDGICFNTLVTFKEQGITTDTEPLTLCDETCRWQFLENKDLCQHLENRITQSMVVPFNI
uniref:Nudix (nucleoside diphosphate linked moiety X)-type motif 18 n=1 Tax=Eptatretus burgeri TaxID=7764 RepID=A0A8C4R8U9_EPTBU